MRRAAATLLAALFAAVALTTAPQAGAHATRIATDPAVDAVLDAGPPRVSATFNEKLQQTFAAMTVVGPDGNLWSSGQASIQGAVAAVDVLPLGPAGTYTVNYRVTSADGHVVSGSWPFHLSKPGTGKPGPPVAGTENPAPTDRFPLWPFVAIAAIGIGVGIWWVFRRRTRR